MTGYVSLKDNLKVAGSENALELAHALFNGFLEQYAGDEEEKSARDLAKRLYNTSSLSNDLPDVLTEALELAENPAAFEALLDIWQKTPLLIQRGNDQALRNAVYALKQQNGPTPYSIDGVFEKLDLEHSDLATLKEALMAMAIITLTRHPTTVFPDETYQESADIGEQLHNVARDVAKHKNASESAGNLLNALAGLKVADTTLAQAKKDTGMEGKEELNQLEHAYDGVTIVVNKFLKRIAEIDNDERREELFSFVRDEFAPILFAVWGAGPDMDNNLAATAKGAEEFHKKANVKVKSRYNNDLNKIIRLVPAGKNKQELRMQAMALVASNDNHRDEGQAHHLNSICEMLTGIDKEHPDKPRLRIRIIDFLVKSRCFKLNFSHLDFRQDTEITSAVATAAFGAPAQDENYLDWLSSQVEEAKRHPDAAFEKLKAMVADLAQRVKDDVEMPVSGQMLETIHSLLVIRKYPNSTRQYTLSQFSKPEHWMQMELLLQAAGVGQVGIVPLSEADEALATFGATMRALGHKPAFQDKLAKLLHFTAMQAKSDPTRESGGFVAGSQARMMIGFADFACDVTLNQVDGVDFNKVFKSFFAVYTGSALDNNRSMFNAAQIQHDFFRAIAYVAKNRGLNDGEIEKLGDAFAAAFQFTLQGRDADYCLGTSQAAAETIAKSWASCVHFKRGLQNLVNIVKDKKNENVLESLNGFIDACDERKKSYDYYFKQMLNYQTDLVPAYIRKLGNISSRKAGRKGDKLTDVRAIDLQGFLHGAGIFTNEWLGAERDTPKAARARFIDSPEERKQALSTLIGMARCDFEGAYLLTGHNVPTQAEKDAGAALVEKYFLAGREFKPTEIAMELAERDNGLNATQAILAWLEQKHQKAKVNTLYAIGLEDAGYSLQQIENWDLARQGLPFNHPVNTELKLLREHSVKTRRLMARVREKWGDGNAEKKNSPLLALYRTVFESSVTPTSVTINGSISGLFELTSGMANKPQDIFQMAMAA